MNNDNNNKEEHKDSLIDLNNLDKMSEEEINELLDKLEKDISNGDSNKKIIKIDLSTSLFKNIFLEFIYEFFISFILIFTFNNLFEVIDSTFFGLLFFSFLYMIIDFSFCKFITKRYQLIMFLSFGVIGLIISCLAFFVSGVTCIQLFKISFDNIGLIVLLMIIFNICRKFVLRYLMKFIFNLRKKENHV